MSAGIDLFVTLPTSSMDPPVAYLRLLPVEVWLECWTLCSIRQIRRLSLVCHLFRSICLPLLLQDQTFDMEALRSGIDQDSWMNHVRHLHRTAVRLDKLAEAPFARFVQTWK
ncbi:hypothetical protein B0H13DRAFT_1662719, partial [Mycena leptocephala]